MIANIASIEVLRKHPMYKYLLIQTFGIAVALSGTAAVYTNYAVEIAGLTGAQMGIVQSVREIPGLLSFTLLAFLLLTTEMRLMSFSVLLIGLGIYALGFFPHFWGILICLLITSIGFHYTESVGQSLTLQHFDRHESPLVIGSMRSITALGSFSIGLMVFLLAGTLSYPVMFLIIGSGCFLGGIWGVAQKNIPNKSGPQQKGFVIRKKYWLYYVLNILSGGRRQIFAVFSILLLVDKFGFSLREIALLFLVNYFINWLLNRYIGKVILRFGERRLLTVKYCVLMLVFVAYAHSDSAMVVAMLYVVEQLFFNFTIAIRTFFQKIAAPEDIAPSMAMGVTFNHVAAVLVPALGGFLWMINFQLVFYMGACLVACSLVALQFMNRQLAQAESLAEKGADVGKPA